MKQIIAHMALVVRDYDEAIQFYTQKLGFILKEDTVLSEHKRWVLVSPPGSVDAPSCSPGPRIPNNYGLSATSQADGFFYFFLRTTLSGITGTFLTRMFISSGGQFRRAMEEWRFSRISMVISGT
jgi:hypothetical protein